MSSITLRQAAEWCGGRIDPKYADVTFLGANMDSRKIQPGQLFVALEGVRDGHEFIGVAFDKGAAAVLCKHCREDRPAILVEDPRVALGLIAAGERQRLGMKVVGVTGSVGKSTTKEMIAAVLEGDFFVSKTPANHNNDIGMPMAILAMPAQTEVAVLEMGMNHFREIAYLTNIAKPDMAVIINVGTMHIEHLGSREGILQAKLEILEGMEENAPLFINADNDMLGTWEPTHQTIRFGLGADCAVRAENIVEDCGSIAYQVTAANVGTVGLDGPSAQRQFPVTLPLEGMHYVSDSLAAVSVGLYMGVGPETIASRLADFRNMEGRQEIFAAKGCTIIKDCYNAGPESMAAALKVLGKRPGRRIAVLGDMLELGDCAPQEHKKVGLIASQNADFVLAYGSHAKFVAEGAPGAVVFDDREKMAAALRSLAKDGDVLLFKGSHGMHMELVLEKFLET